MKPTPMMFRWQIARLIRKGRVSSKIVFNGEKPGVVRVSVQDYSRNLDKIAAFWSDVPVLYFVFPRLGKDISEHDEVLMGRKGIEFKNKFVNNDFFLNDEIHLNRQGNQHLSKVLTPHTLELLRESKHVE